MDLPKILSVAILVLFSNSVPCGTIPVDQLDPQVCQTDICHESAQYILDSIDTSVDPCDDFYRYACGGWIDKHEIPEGQDSVSAYAALAEEVVENVAELLKNPITENQPKAIRDVATLFQGCINEPARNALGLDPLKNIIHSFGGWPMIDPDWTPPNSEWYARVANVRRTLGIDAIIAFTVAADELNPLRNLPYLGEPDFGVPAENLKNLTSEENEEVLKAYRKFIIDVAKSMNPDLSAEELDKEVDEIIQFESNLAQANYSVGDLNTINPWYQEVIDTVVMRVTKGPKVMGLPVSEVQEITKNEYFQWKDYLNIVLQDFPEVTDESEVVPYERRYLEHAVQVAYNTDTRIVANYIGWTIARELVSHTTKVLRAKDYLFKVKVVEGFSEEWNLTKYCVKEATDLFGFTVGRLYVDKYISEEEKEDVEELVEDIRSAYEVSFIHNEWIDADTKAKALEKLRAMLSLVGYPDWIKDDDELNKYYELDGELNKDEYFTSWVKAKSAAEARTLVKWNQPTRRDIDWHDNPTVVNAFYFPNYNAMMLPAGILHPPFYKHGRLPALNHGAIGAFVAHEISHGFDNTGSRHDKEGHEKNWWSKETKAKFEDKIECYKNQYSSIVDPVTNMNLNGNGTIGDDIADNGGVKNAYLAFKLACLQSEENEIMPKKKLPGISATSEQLFFISFAHLNCERRTKESMEWFIENEEHSPEEYRITVPLRNSRAFSEAFHCPPGSPMNPAAKCTMW